MVSRFTPHDQLVRLYFIYIIYIHVHNIHAVIGHTSERAATTRLRLVVAVVVDLVASTHLTRNIDAAMPVNLYDDAVCVHV